MTDGNDEDGLELHFTEIPSEVDSNRELIYLWEIADGSGAVVYRYVGKAKRGAKQLLDHDQRNVRNLLAVRPDQEERPSQFREVHHKMAEAVRLGHRITLEFLCNVVDEEDIKKVEQKWHRQLVPGAESVAGRSGGGRPELRTRADGAPEPSLSLTLEQRRHFRDELKAGRAAALADAEGYTQLLVSVERLGRLLSGEVNLSRMRQSLTRLASASPLAESIPLMRPACHSAFGVLFEHVRISRNDAMHEGAFARHITLHLTQLALVLEDALMVHSRLVGDFIVRNPTPALLWQPLSFLRQVMLSQSFSFMPVPPDGDQPWRVVVDRDVASFIQGAADRQQALAMTLREAVDSGRLPLHQPYCCGRDTTAADALKASRDLPVLVVEGGHLLGMATAFDLL